MWVGVSLNAVRIRVLVGIALACSLAVPASAAAQLPGLPPLPIPEDPLPPQDLPQFVGGPATPQPVSGPTLPQHPFMAANGTSNIHDDAYMTDTYAWSGPLGRDVQVSSTFFARECGSVTIDSAGRLETICVGLDRPVLTLLDPVTLEVLASYELPPRNPSPNPFRDFTGGGYFYLDEQDRAVAPTSNRHIFVVAQTDGPDFELVRDYDLSAVVASGDGIISVLPDWDGRLWFASNKGVVGFVDPATGAIESRQLGEGITNSFAVDDSGGVFIVTDKAMYRFDARGGGVDETWREVYENSGVAKPGQSDAGSGTTPTVVGRNYVAITDNAAQAAAPAGEEAQAQGQAAAQQADLCPRRLLAGGRLDRPVADRRREEDRRREQLRLHGAVVDDERRHHRAGARAGGRPQARPGMQDGLALGRARPLGGPQAVARQRPRLHVHQAAA